MTSPTKKLRDMQTMSTGVSGSHFAQGEHLTLHGIDATVIVSDAQNTSVQYPNGTQRQFHTIDLEAYQNLGVFPTSSYFSRPTPNGTEKAYVEQALTGSYIMEMVGVGGEEPGTPEPMTAAELMAWHMAGTKAPAEQTVPGTLYVPKVGADPDTEPDDEPFETELKDEVADLAAKLASANQALQESTIKGQMAINQLQRAESELNDIRAQNALHVAKLFALSAELEDLRVKASLLAAVPRQYDMKQNATIADLDAHSKDGWQTEHMQFTDSGSLNVVFVRDLPAATAPKVAATDAAIYSAVPAARPPITQPPSQTIIMQGASGEPRRILTPQALQEQHQRHANEIDEIFSRHAERAEASRRQMAIQSRSFPIVGE